MAPIVVGSVLGLAIVVERMVVLLGISAREGRACLDRALNGIRQGRLTEALSAVEGTDHPVAPVLRRGLEQWGLPLGTVERLMEQTAQQQIRHLERWLGTLASIIAVEPMLGFLGTITGLIRAFMAWESAGNRVTVSLLASGIYEAMITTAAGLLVAIPLLVAHNGFVSQIRRIAGQLTDASNEFLEEYARRHSKGTADEAAVHARLPVES